jgi:hypothetical protein
MVFMVSISWEGGSPVATPPSLRRIDAGVT